jgi:hypothetical protein
VRVHTARVRGLHGLLLRESAAHLREPAASHLRLKRRGLWRVVASANVRDRGALGQCSTHCQHHQAGQRQRRHDKQREEEREKDTREWGDGDGLPKSTLTPPMASKAARGSSAPPALMERKVSGRHAHTRGDTSHT